MSVVIFWHVLFWHFAQCFDMCCAQLFVCLVAFFFAFRLFMCNYLLAIFVAMVLRIAFCFFFCQNAHFFYFLFLCRFLLVALPRFAWGFCRSDLRFGHSGDFYCYPFAFSLFLRLLSNRLMLFGLISCHFFFFTSMAVG